LGSGYDLEIHIHRGAGAYICGEETGLIESLEGKRAYPRIKPPYFPAVLGLYMCPTIVNNVETLATVKHIILMGGPAYAKLGTPNNTGTRIVSVSGHVKKPGYYEVEVGKATLGEMIFDPNFGGGLREGRQLKAVIPGGSSAKVFKAGEKFKMKRKGADGQMAAVEVDMLDLPYDFDSLQQAGSMSGSGAIIVMDDTTDIVEALANLADFYAHESCGQCTPCREGSLWLAKALHRVANGQGRKRDADYLLSIAQNIQGRTICAFGEACAWPVLSFVNKFRDEFEARGAAGETNQAAGGPSHAMKLAASP
jgi:NADH-quinone oxidoreductase subunit F